MWRRRLSALAILATLVLAACGGGEGESSAEPRATQTPDQTESPPADIVVVAKPTFAFEPSQLEAEAGTISVALTNEGGPHTFTVELDEGPDTVASVYNVPETGTGEIELEAGTYIFFCAVLDHREQGMEGTLTVT